MDVRVKDFWWYDNTWLDVCVKYFFIRSASTLNPTFIMHVCNNARRFENVCNQNLLEDLS